MARVGRKERQILAILDRLKPDLVFLTGDYVQWKGSYEAALEFLSKITARNGVWAVLGDYDYSDARKSCLFCHKEGTGLPTSRHTVHFLRDYPQEIILSEGSFWLAGIDANGAFNSDSTRNPFSCNTKKPAIVLSHSPLAFDQIDENQNVLVLAGDTHGGQVPLPGWLWELLGYEKNARFGQGLFQQGQKQMFVSRGTGTSHLPIRIGRRPEVVILEFVDGR